ncbi:MAG: UDP-2,3-diacylglucosamine diphosphatase [Xanthomonadales bacterium]|nr:UDP-2,3-diacylglucosamine diphosphatase [Xanthomonadales bacterium]NIX12767.1 UDP-2,3-diacylglucosamine diphosphatase [Xanthomonadales bacterium]
MTTLFISDLHLHDDRPGATELLLEFLSGDAAGADALYILGDLFEYWIGDDVETRTSRQVADGLADLREAGVPCFFMHGNRDFLVGERFAARAGMQLLPEEQVVRLYGQPALLLHGDTLCTDDTVYQARRAEVRKPEWQEAFLSRTPRERVAFARDVRQESARYKETASAEIMDVNDGAVRNAFTRHGVDLMIHGHTHRPAVHELELGDGPARRIVLGDWYEQGSVLRVTPYGAKLETLVFPG